MARGGRKLAFPMGTTLFWEREERRKQQHEPWPLRPRGLAKGLVEE